MVPYHKHNLCRCCWLLVVVVVVDIHRFGEEEEERKKIHAGYTHRDRHIII